MICRDLKYCEHISITFSEAEESTFHGLNQWIFSWCKFKGILEESLLDWRHLLRNEMELTSKAKYAKFKTNNIVLYTNSNKDSPAELHQRSIVTPIDKTNWTFAMICQGFYALTLMKGLMGNHGTPLKYMKHV